MLKLKIAVMALGAFLLAACETAPAPAAPPSAGHPMASPPQAEYTLDSGDKLMITVFGEPDLSGPFEVSGQGDISMRLIGEVKARGLTLRELQRTIEANYKDRQILRDPQVSAEVTNYRPFYVSGEVKTPGEYPYIAGLTVLNAIARAGDFSYRADKRSVLITSKKTGVEQEYELTPNLLVHPGDTIKVKGRIF